MAITYPVHFRGDERDKPDVRVPAPQQQGSAVIIQLHGDDADYDPGTDTVQVEGDDGSVTVSFGEPQPDRREDEDFGDNLAEDLTDSQLTAVAERLLAGIEADEMSRHSWLENAAKGIGLLGLELKAQQGASTGSAQTPIEGTSNVDHPLLLEAVLRFQANARGELLPADGPVKIRNDGENNELTLTLSQALEKDLNTYLTKTAKEYYPDTDRMLLLLGFSGIAFKKGYHDPIKRRPVIASIDAKDLIVSNATTDIDSAGRVTHRFMARPAWLKRMQLLGAYRDIALPPPPLMPLRNAVDEKIQQVQGIAPVGITYETADLDREMYECYCEIELPGFEHKIKGEQTGLPLPYRVVIDRDSRKILEIRRNWDEDDPLCLPQNRIIAYIFIPGLGFYGIGLLNVLGNTTKAVTAAWRLMLDAGMFANFPGFLYLKAFAKQMTNQFRIPPGGGQPIDTIGNDIRAAVMPLPYKDPSAVFIQLIDNITQISQRVGGTAEISVGEGKQDAPVGTTLALLEQAVKLMSAVHKRLHQAQTQELEMLKTLLMEDPEALWRHNKKSAVLRHLNQQIPELTPISAQQDMTDAKRKQMFLAALADADLSPAADPNTSSQTERYLKVYALRQIAMTNPNIDLNAVDQHAIKVLGFENPQGFAKQVDPNAPPPPPPPEVLMAQASQQSAQARIMDAQTRMVEAQAKQQSAARDADAKMQELAIRKQISEQSVQRELIIHQSDQANENARLMRAQQQDSAKQQMDHAENERAREHEQVTSTIGHVMTARQQQADREHQLAQQTADRQHALRQQAIDHLVDLHKQQTERGHAVQQFGLEHAADMREAGVGHAVKMHDGHQERLHKLYNQGLVHRHEAHQRELDRRHEAEQQQREREHQATQASQEQAHARQLQKEKPKPKPAGGGAKKKE